MSVIIRLQNLPWSANSLDIRRFFNGLSIPEGGVHIVGGEKGDAFIAFSTDEDARQAMERDGGRIREIKVKLLLSSRTEMQRVIEQARNQSLGIQPTVPQTQPKGSSKEKDNERKHTPDRAKSPDRRRDKERSPKDKERSRRSGRSHRSRSRSPRRSRDRERDRDQDRRNERQRRDEKSSDRLKPPDQASQPKDNDIRARNTGLSREQREPAFTPGGVPNGGMGISPQARGILFEEPTLMLENDHVHSGHPPFPPNYDQAGQISHWGQSFPPEDTRDQWREERQGLLVPPGQFGGRPDPRGAPLAPHEKGYHVSGTPYRGRYLGNEVVPERHGVSFPDRRITHDENRRSGFDEQRGRGIEPLDRNPSHTGPSYEDHGTEQMENFVENLPHRFAGHPPHDDYDGRGYPPTSMSGDPRGRGAPPGPRNPVVRGQDPRAFRPVKDRPVPHGPDGRPPLLTGRGHHPGGPFESEYESYSELPPRGPPGPCVEIRGLPRDVRPVDVHELLRGIHIPSNAIKLTYDGHGVPTGYAYVRFAKPQDVVEALKRTGQMIGDSYIEIVNCPERMFAEADSYPNPPSSGRKPPPSASFMGHHPPREDDLCIYLRGLPYHCCDEDIINFFDGLRILDIFIEYDRNGRAVGTGFVEFGTSEDFQAALAMDRKMIGHRYIELSVASKSMMNEAKGGEEPGPRPSGWMGTRKELLPPPAEQKGPSCVALHGLPVEISDQEVADFFAEVGIIPRAIHIMLGPNGLPSGDAFAEFASNDEVVLALKKNQQYLGLKVVAVKPITYQEMIDVLEGPPSEQDALLQPPDPSLSQRNSGKPLMNTPPEKGRYLMEPPTGRGRGKPLLESAGRGKSAGEPMARGRGRPLLEAGGMGRGQSPIHEDHIQSDNHDTHPHGLPGRRGPMGLDRWAGPPEGPPMGRGHRGYPPERPLPHDRYPSGIDGSGGPRFHGPRPEEGNGLSDHYRSLGPRGPPGGPMGSSNRGHPDGPLRTGNRGPADVLMGPDSRKPLDGPMGPRRGPPEGPMGPGKIGPPESQLGLSSRGSSNRVTGPGNRGPEGSVGLDKGPSEGITGHGAKDSLDKPGGPDDRGPQENPVGPKRRGTSGESQTGQGHSGVPESHMERTNPDPRGPPLGSRGPPQSAYPRGPMMERPRGLRPPRPLDPGPKGFGKPGCVIAASNVPYRATVEDLLSFFEGYELTKNSVIRRFNETGQPTGDARIALKSPEDALKAVKELNGKEIAGRPVTLQMV
ncbi:RNA-binding protein 12-like isoform X2 [Limulus polyphemus]|nr:RNA-binding protein 12-like isoform X2 [Limulus polyphemus]